MIKKIHIYIYIKISLLYDSKIYKKNKKYVVYYYKKIYTKIKIKTLISNLVSTTLFILC